MKRLLLLLAVAAMMLTVLTAGPAFAAKEKEGLPPFGDKFTDPDPNDQEPEPTPGNPQSPDKNPEKFPEDPTSDQGPARNFIGEDQRTGAAGPGTPNPGSAAKPTTFDGEPAFNGPVTSTIGTLPGTVFDPDTTKPNVISAFQEFKRCSLLGPPSCPEEES